MTGSSRVSGRASRSRISILAMGTRNNLGLAAIFMAAMREWKRSQDAALRAGFQGVQKRIEKVMDVQIQKEMSTTSSRACCSWPPPVGGALHRPVRHGLGHHDLVPGHRQFAEHQSRRGGAGHRGSAVCHGHRPRCRHTGDNLLQHVLGGRGPASACGWRISRMSSRRSSRASWMNGCKRWVHHQAGRKGGYTRRNARRRASAGVMQRDQRDAAGRRHAGAADRVHGGGAADDGGRAHRASQDRSQAAEQPASSRSPSRSRPTARSISGNQDDRLRNSSRNCGHAKARL